MNNIRGKIKINKNKPELYKTISKRMAKKFCFYCGDKAKQAYYAFNIEKKCPILFEIAGLFHGCKIPVCYLCWNADAPLYERMEERLRKAFENSP